MADPSPARFLAPLALIVAVIGVIVVVLTSSGGTPTPALTPHAITTREVRSTKPHARSYVVKAGDSLTAIAARTGVSIDTIEQLNPDADPQALRVGERLKLTQ